MNINISLKLNQMLLDGKAEESEKGERERVKNTGSTQESESVPRPQYFEMFIPQLLCPPFPRPLPPNLEQGNILEETGEKSCPAWI